MGYTHYWRRESAEIDRGVWQRFIERLETVIMKHKDVVSVPSLTSERVWINGLGDDAYEDFVIDRVSKGQPSREFFDFCKTARRPYDPIVVAALCILRDEVVKANDPSGFHWSSDGDPEEHAQGVELAGLTESNVDPR